jgi:hypothetical protein
VQRIDQDHPGECRKVTEAFAEILADLDRAPDAPGTDRLDGHAGDIGERRVDRTDGRVGEMCYRAGSIMHD